ncbi:hypothetical protein C2S51_020795 [Perilla frutescens var. frutescens]|nr:hypothetical protein C2S51_020795 [Perilla frutescens var. frutescens]
MNANKPHVYVLPFPVQSHINPMLEFSKCLASNTNLINVTFLITTITNKSIIKLPPNSSITFESISDGSEETQEPQNSADFRRLENIVYKKVTKFFIDQQKSSHTTVVYDSVFPWMLDIAHQHGLLGASFFTQSCSVSAIYYHIKQGLLSFPFEDQSELDLPFLPKLQTNDLPALEKVMDSNHTMLEVLVGQFSNLEKADFVLFNTFDGLEIEVVQWMMTCWTIKTIGPTHSLLQNDVVNTPHKNNQMINLFEPNQEACRKWLDSKETSSVVYVSFGSLASLEKSQIEELAWGLMMSKCSFLWVVRASEEHKLPPNFTSLACERGLIVNWCTQTQVLAHHAVSCFLTHGGWNSTMEGLSYGVPLIVMAQWVDQTTNAKFIEDVWRVGVRVRGSENGMVSKEEVCMCVVDIAQGDKGRELRLNASKLKKLAEEAVGEGGTTTKNIEDIVSRIMCF